MAALFFMESFALLAANLKKIDFDKMLSEIMKLPKIKDQITKDIQFRLFGTGKDSEGNSLKTDKSIKEGLGNVYAHSTINEIEPPGRFRGKKQRGQKFSNVTLSNDGDFYLSLDIISNLFGFETQADFMKEDGHIYDNFKMSYGNKNIFEDKITGINKKEINELKQSVYKILFKRLNEIL